MSSQNNQQWWDRFQELLDEGAEWPSEYLFKFIVPRQHLEEVERLFHKLPFKVRESRKGNYASVTASVEMHSSDEVIAMYTTAAKIEGIILL
jgi:putative lipoic acid-binding regulatory protein